MAPSDNASNRCWLRTGPGVRLPSCGYLKSVQVRQRNFFECMRCKHRTSVTSRRLFDDIKLPLTTWFLSSYVL